MKTLILAFLLLLGGCFDPVAESTVLLMGDSIAQEITDEMSFEIHWQDNAPIFIVNSIGGMTAAFGDAGEYWAGRIRQANADTIFISLGTNDAAAKIELVDFDYAAHLILDAAGDAKVYWLLPSPSSDIEGMMEVRAVISEVVAMYPNVEVVEVGEGLLDTDNIHLSDEGELETAKQFIGLL